MKKHQICAAVLFCFLLIPHFASADDSAEKIKTQMLTRLPVINDLKERGIIGETNQGFLAVLKPGRADPDLAEAENRDRKKVYAIIAEKIGTTVERVGKRRAKQIAESAPAGHWVQNESGKWHKKATNEKKLK